jgi:hypothetical protein
VWTHGKTFSDTVSHFSRFSKETIQKFFGVHGQWADIKGAPNWVQPIATETGPEYQFITLDDSGDLVKEHPFFLKIRPVPNIEAFAPPEAGKGRGVAAWDYRAVVGDLTLWSDDPVKRIVCNPDGLVYAFGSRMSAGPTAKFTSYNQLNIGMPSSRLAITPFAVLSFFMWMDTEEARPVRNYLSLIGWQFDEA